MLRMMLIDDAGQDDGCIEVDLDLVNLDDVEGVFDDVVPDVEVYIVVVADLLDDEVVDVDVIDVLGDVVVVANLIDVVVDDVVYDDVDVDALTVVVVSELLVGNDDVDDVNVDSFVDDIYEVLPVDVVV